MAADIRLHADSRAQSVNFDETNIIRDGGGGAPPDVARDGYEFTRDGGDAAGDQPGGKCNDRQIESPPRRAQRADRRLDEDLKETFPASDPASINPGAD